MEKTAEFIKNDKEILKIYGTIEVWEIKNWLKVFHESSNINIHYEREYVYKNPPIMAKRILDEINNNEKSADVVLSAVSPQMKMLDLFIPYVSDNRTNIPVDFMDDLGYWTSVLLLPTIQIFNPKELDTNQIPRTINDLGHEFLKDKISLHDPTYGSFGGQWLSSIRTIIGDDDWHRLLSNLSLLRPRKFPLFIDIINDVSNGNSSVGLTVMLYEYLRERQSKKNIERLIISDLPILLSSTAVSLVKYSKNTNLAKKFIDFLLSPECQNMIGNTDIRIPASDRTDSKYSLQNLIPDEKFVFFPSAETFNRAASDAIYYQKIFP